MEAGDGFGAVHDAADTDEMALGREEGAELGEDGAAALGEGCAGESAFDLGIGFEGGSGEGGVGGDDAGEIELVGEFGDFFDLGFGEIGGDFDEEGAVGVDVFEAGEDFGERAAVLEGAEAGGVGAADVDDEVVAFVLEEAIGEGVVFGGFFEGGDFGFAEVDADDEVGGAVFEAGGEGFGALVVEPETVDEGAFGGEAEEAGFGVAGLGVAGDGADFDESEAAVGPVVEGDAVFVEAGGESDGVGEGDSEKGAGEAWGLGGADESELDGFESEIVGVFGVEAEEDWLERIVKAHVGEESTFFGNWCALTSLL